MSQLAIIVHEDVVSVWDIFEVILSKYPLLILTKYPSYIFIDTASYYIVSTMFKAFPSLNYKYLDYFEHMLTVGVYRGRVVRVSPRTVALIAKTTYPIDLKF